MLNLSFKSTFTIFVTFVFILTVAGSKAHAQSEASVEKANSITTVLIVSALVITAAAVILTISKGDKKDKEGEKQNNPEEQKEQQKPEGRAWIEPSLLSSQVAAPREYETVQVNSMLDNVPFSLVENAGGQQHLGCWRLAYEME